MPAEVDRENCTGCADCVTACPVDGAITMDGDKAVVTPEECIECNACVDTCSSQAMKMAS